MQKNVMSQIGELRLDAVESEVTGFRVYSQCRTALSYHVVVRSEKTKQDWVRKIDEVIKMNTESMKKVCPRWSAVAYK